MKQSLHTCCVCQRQFFSEARHARICSDECRRLYHKEKYRIQKARKNTAPQSENMKQYYAYCEKNGFVTYGKFQAMKTANALKEQKGVQI